MISLSLSIYIYIYAHTTSDYKLLYDTILFTTFEHKLVQNVLLLKYSYNTVFEHNLV